MDQELGRRQEELQQYQEEVALSRKSKEARTLSKSAVSGAAALKSSRALDASRGGADDCDAPGGLDQKGWGAVRENDSGGPKGQGRREKAEKEEEEEANSKEKVLEAADLVGRFSAFVESLSGLDGAEVGGASSYSFCLAPSLDSTQVLLFLALLSV